MTPIRPSLGFAYPPASGNSTHRRLFRICFRLFAGEATLHFVSNKALRQFNVEAFRVRHNCAAPLSIGPARRNFDRRSTEVRAKRLVGQLAKLGFEVKLTPFARAA
jgi:hypothetical protein